MMVEIQILGHTASVSKGNWTSENELVARFLNEDRNPRGPSGEYPDTDYSLAVQAAERWGGTILRTDSEPVSVPGRVY